jgi:hypothetical protein
MWSFLEKLMIPCLWKSIFHIDCPGCGLQRSVFLLFRGDLAESLRMYWATIPILLMLIFLAFHIKFHFAKGNRILVWMYCGNAVLIICHYIYKLSIN